VMSRAFPRDPNIRQQVDTIEEGRVDDFSPFGPFHVCGKPNGPGSTAAGFSCPHDVYFGTHAKFP
jgi:hypothetical protein